MSIVLNGTTGITNDGGYTGDGVVFADTTPANTLVTTTGGNVGIGTSSPGAKLAVVSGVEGESLVYNNTNSSVTAANKFGYVIQESGSTVVSLRYRRDGTGTAELFNQSSILAFGTNNTERARIDSAGNFVQAAGCRIYSIGTYNLTTAAAANLNVDGNGTFFRSTSALKYKKDIRNLENIDINLFRAVRYKSKSESDDQTKDHFGIVADEVDAAGIKELVNYGVEGDVEGFQYERLTVVLLKHCQEQQAIINALTARVEALEGTQP